MVGQEFVRSRLLAVCAIALLFSSQVAFSQTEELNAARAALRLKGVDFGMHTSSSIYVPFTAAITDEDIELLELIASSDFSGTVVTRLSIDNHCIKAKGFSVLGEFSKLKSLSISGVGVDDRAVAQLAGRTSLHSVALGGAMRGETLESLQQNEGLAKLELHGKNLGFGDHGAVELTDEGMRQLGSLTQLRQLTLSNCGVRDSQFHSLSEMKNLERLWINRSPMSGAGLSQLPTSQLKSLLITRSGLSDRGMTRLPPFPKLQGLNLTDNQIGDGTVAALAQAGADQLTKLELTRTDVTDACVKDLVKLPAIEELSLDMTKVQGRGFRQLAKLQNLTGIGLGRTDVDDEGIAEIAHLKRVTGLLLTGTAITEKSASDLMKMNQLEYLALSKGVMSKPTLEAMRKSLPNCQIVEMDDTRLPNIERLPF